MFKKLIILNILYIFTALMGLCFSEEELAGLEYSKYGRVYTGESISERLNRLENDFLGMAQSGDIDSRISLLSKLNGNSRGSAIINPLENYYPAQKKSALRNFWDNITSTFSDSESITGFTPPISTSGYNLGYSNNMYRNNFTDFLNNPSGYCPYYNRYNFYNNRFFNRNYHNNHGFINSNSQNNRFNNFYNKNFRLQPNIYNCFTPRLGAYNPMTDAYNPYNRYTRTYFQTPPDMTTKSSVQIIKD